MCRSRCHARAYRYWSSKFTGEHIRDGLSYRIGAYRARPTPWETPDQLDRAAAERSFRACKLATKRSCGLIRRKRAFDPQLIQSDVARCTECGNRRKESQLALFLTEHDRQ